MNANTTSTPRATKRKVAAGTRTTTAKEQLLNDPVLQTPTRAVVSPMRKFGANIGGVAAGATAYYVGANFSVLIANAVLNGTGVYFLGWLTMMIGVFASLLIMLSIMFPITYFLEHCTREQCVEVSESAIVLVASTVQSVKRSVFGMFNKKASV